MDLFAFMLVFGLVGWLLFVLFFVLFMLTGDGKTIATARLTGKFIATVADPESRKVHVEKVKGELVSLKDGYPYLLGGWPAYMWNGIKTFFLIKRGVVDFDPEVLDEVQKAINEGVTSWDELKDKFIEEKVQVVKRKLPDGSEVEEQVVVPVFRPFRGRTHRLVKVVLPKKAKKGGAAYFLVEEYTPVNLYLLNEFFNRKFKGETIQKILKLKDVECLEKVQRAIRETMKKLGAKVKEQSSGGFNPVWIVFIAVAIVIILIGLHIFMQKPTTPPIPKG